jgi:hypothetical protein
VRAGGDAAAPIAKLTAAVDDHETHPVDRFFSTLLEGGHGLLFRG